MQSPDRWQRFWTWARGPKCHVCRRRHGRGTFGATWYWACETNARNRANAEQWMRANNDYVVRQVERKMGKPL